MTETELERLVVRLIGDDSSYQAMFRDAERAARRFEGTIDNVTNAEREHSAAVKRGADITRSVENATEKYDREMAELNQHLRQGTISQTTFNRATKLAKGHLNAARRSMADYGRSIAAAGMKASLFVTAPILAMGVAAVKAGSDIDSAFAGVRKTVNATEQELLAIKQAFIDSVMAGTPVDLTEMLGIAETAGQLGIDPSNIVDFSQVIAELKITTNLGDEAASTMARIANITGLPEGEYRNLASAIVALGNNSATTENEIGAMMLRLAAAGTAAGMSVDQIAGFSAALSSVGIEAEAGGTAFSKLFRDITSSIALGSDELEYFAKTAGVSVEQFKEDFRKDAAGAVQALLRGLGELNNEDATVRLQQMGVEGGRMSDAMLRASLAVDKLDAALALSAAEYRKNTALAAEAEVKYKSFASQVKNLWAQIKILGGEVFRILEPALRGTITILKQGVAIFSGFSDGTKTAVIAVAALAAAIGPLLLTVGTMLVIIPQLTIGWGIATTALAGYTAATLASTIASAALNYALLASPYAIIAAEVLILISLIIDLKDAYADLNEQLDKSGELNNKLIQDSAKRVQAIIDEAKALANAGQAHTAEATIDIGLEDALNRLEEFKKQVRRAAQEVEDNAFNFLDVPAQMAARQELEESVDRMRAAQAEVNALRAVDLTPEVNPPATPEEAAAAEAEAAGLDPETLEGVEALDEALQDQINTFGMTQREIAIYRLKLAGATDEQLKFVQAMSDGLTTMEENQEKLDALASTTETLQHQLDTFGMTADEIKLFDLENLGATAAELAVIKLQMLALQNMKATKKRGEDAKKLTEKYLPPEEKLRKEKERLQGLFDDGLIDQHTFDSATEAAEKAFGNIADKAKKGIGLEISVREAAGAGTVEAMARIQDFLDKSALEVNPPVVPPNVPANVPPAALGAPAAAGNIMDPHAPENIPGLNEGQAAPIGIGNIIDPNQAQVPQVLPPPANEIPTGPLAPVFQALPSIPTTPANAQAAAVMGLSDSELVSRIKAETPEGRPTTAALPVAEENNVDRENSDSEVLDRIAVATERLVTANEGRPIIELQEAGF